ncbi:Thyroid receptor-interacting protein 11 [Schistosoma japonicum]|nr:Thyroid receptor-interacting protein 11 [Schistosoma japonicum]KAH8860612.1 Thyroid receptor-interacting protein 11 [Schistosoma japonicum]KAH8860615.1 Thyroid receptor-interacting protein 11 [Schistosoma japonicum]
MHEIFNRQLLITHTSEQFLANFFTPSWSDNNASSSVLDNFSKEDRISSLFSTPFLKYKCLIGDKNHNKLPVVCPTQPRKMDWLGGLSSIKGQITNITKDLLAEGTREINDSTSELLLARTRICELESVVENQKTEINSLRSRNEDLLVQLESSQLRLDHTKELFIEQLRDKEIVITKLRSEISNERGEPEGQPEASLGTTVSHIDISVSKSGLRQYLDHASEDYQVPSSISHSDGTVTWDELKNEVVQLRAELTKWKRIAKKKEKTADNTSSYELLNIELEKQVEQLKKQLSDSEEIRRNELAAIQDSHSDHLSNLVEQLKETEAEVIRLQKQAEEYYNRCSSCDVSLNQSGLQTHTSGIVNALKKEQSVCAEISDVIDPENQGTSRKLRSGKRKKKKLPNIQVETMDTLKLSKSVSCEISSQTDYNQMKDSSIQAGIKIKTKDAFTECDLYRSSCSTSVQTESVVQPLSKGSQTDLPHEPVASIPVSSIAIQFSSVDRDFSYPLVDASGNNDGFLSSGESQQTQSFLHEVFDKSGEANELVDQLASEINSYNQFTFSMLIRNGIIESSKSISPMHQPVLFSQSDHETTKVDILEKLKLLIDTIKSHHECIIKNEAHKTVNMSLSVPFSSKRLSSEISDSTEVELDAWQDDDFPELNSNASEATKCHSGHPSDDIKPQDEANVQQSENVFSKGLVANSNRIAELESLLEPFGRLEQSLNTAVLHLLSLPPPPTMPSHLLDQQSSCTWPPTSVEDKLALLTASEISSRNEIIRLNNSLLSVEEKCKQLEVDNQQLYNQITRYEDILKSSSHSGNIEVTDDFIELSSLAYQLCVSLDPEVGEKEWNPDDWEVELFTLLKDRLDSEETEVVDDNQSSNVVKLSAEVAALRDLLAQHTTFRTQAEKDLKHLLSTIQNQHDIIDKMTMEKRQLEFLLSNKESKITPVPVVSVSTTTPMFTANIITTISTSTSTTDDDVSNDSDHIPKTFVDTETQASLSIDNSIELTNKSNEDYAHYCKELIKFIYSIYNDQFANSSPNSPSRDITPESLKLTNKPEVFSLLEKFSVRFHEFKIDSENFQSMYNTLVNSLHQKHAESQLYHEKLQHCLNELNDMDVNTIVKHSASMDETVTTSCKSVVQPYTDEMHSDEEQTSNNEKLIGEIQRLQAHLVEMEESYTAAAVDAENREVELRSRLNEVEKSFAELKNSCITADTQMRTAYSERDDALKHLETSRREVLDLKDSLKTLQTVLDNFQRKIAAKQEIEELNRSLYGYQELSKELQEMKNVNQQLREQIIRLETKIRNRDTENDGLRDRLAKMAVDTDARIDKYKFFFSVLIFYL